MNKHLSVASELAWTLWLADQLRPIESLFGVTKQHSQGPIKDADRLAVYLPAFCGKLRQDDATRVLEIQRGPAARGDGLGVIAEQTETPSPAQLGSLERLFEEDRHHHVALLAGPKTAQKVQQYPRYQMVMKYCRGHVQRPLSTPPSR